MHVLKFTEAISIGYYYVGSSTSGMAGSALTYGRLSTLDQGTIKELQGFDLSLAL